MRNQYVSRYLAQNPVFALRAKTDKLFALPAGSFDFRESADRAARFIESFQLLDAPLWKKFVDVFREEPRLDSQNNGWRGEYWGKMMRGACITYAYTRNPALYKTIEASVRDMLTVAEPDGRVSSYARDAEFDGWDMWSRKYVMLAMEYFLDISDDAELSAQIVAFIKGQADYIIAHVGRGAGQIPINETSHHWHGLNASSVLEPVVRLYDITKEQKYLDFASYIISEGGCSVDNVFEKALADEVPPSEYGVTKAYEMMSCFEGLLEYYRATGEEKWREAVVRFGRRVLREELTVLGSAGCWHELFDHSADAQFYTDNAGVMQETCVSVTWLKFCTQLLSLTGDPAFADAIEQTAYNALYGAVNFEKLPYNGEVLPFDSYTPLLPGVRNRYIGGRQYLRDGSFYGCCACIGSAGTGLVPLTAVMAREDGVAVNLYLAGTAVCRTPADLPLELAFKTDYPRNGAISITIDTNDEAPFTVALRIPAWSACTVLCVNGQLVQAPAGKYAEITRVWQCGDKIELWPDMRVKVLHPQGRMPDVNSRYHVALRRGPLVLARDARLPGDVNAPVRVFETPDGYAEVKPFDDCPIPAAVALLVRQTDGTWLPVVDFAAAGRTRTAESLLSVWMPTKAYLTVDLKKPCRVSAACQKGYTKQPHGDVHAELGVGEDGTVLCPAPAGQTLTVTVIKGKNGFCRLQTADNTYLALNAAGQLIVDARPADWKLVNEGQNRFHIEAPDGRHLRVPRKPDPLPIELVDINVTPEALFSFAND